MTTELSTTTTAAGGPPASGVALPEPSGDGIPVSLSAWVEAAASAQSLAGMLVNSHFVPIAFKPQIARNSSPDEVRDAVGVAVANATGAILLGQSLGLDPLTSLQQIYVVHGRPGMYAKIKVALALKHGHRVWDEEFGPESVTVCGQRRGTDDVVRITVTMADAKRAGWTSNAAYQKTPADMLWARAASRVVDRIAADVLHGIASLEDLETDTQPAAAPARVTVEDLAGPAAIAAPAPAAPQMIDKNTWTAVNREWTRLGVTGPGSVERRMVAVRRLVDRDVTAGSDLTAAEGDVLLSTLQGIRGLTADVADHLGLYSGPAEVPVVEEDQSADAAAQEHRAPAGDGEADLDPAVTGEWPQDTEVPQ